MLSELHFYAFKEENEDFFGGLMVKNPPANVGDTGSIPSLGMILHAAGQLSPRAATTEARAPRACALQQDKSIHHKEE